MTTNPKYAIISNCDVLVASYNWNKRVKSLSTIDHIFCGGKICISKFIVIKKIDYACNKKVEVINTKFKIYKVEKIYNLLFRLE